jgi:hypothetical protein
MSAIYVNIFCVCIHTIVWIQLQGFVFMCTFYFMSRHTLSESRIHVRYQTSFELG